ncbi:MAG: 4-alpha-glucanotransferase [Clostridia bacterium]|nr:4-alpha-glucanotransferase [Clostridia bacterium]
MRQSGVLLHITSLPSNGGIGTLGKAAYEFVDFIKESGMSIWQMLPLGPTGYAESPYQSCSTFAGNQLVIDFELLEADGLLPKGAYKPLQIEQNVDFEAVKKQHRELMKLSFGSSYAKLSEKIAEFEKTHPFVREYALFRAIKAGFDEISWMEWPDRKARLRDPETIEKYKKELADEIDFYVYEQYIFFDQWSKLHEYAKAKGVMLMGDMPIYVAEDSADVWQNPGMFELDEECRPVRIAGVPPDYFSELGQRWGNPLYAWDKHEATGYSWWISRLRALGEMFDILRIDHFIGFANYYAIPAEEPTALHGKYEPGPGKKLFDKIKAELPGLKIVAEDLGVINQTVRDLLSYCGYPGMKVLQFAFDGELTDPLPETHTKNCFIYTGTHDNNTTLGWWNNAAPEVRERAEKALGISGDEDAVDCMIEAAFSSEADTAVVPMQDLLNLGEECRMNIPGTVGCNWMWRMLPVDYAAIAGKVRMLNIKNNRGVFF